MQPAPGQKTARGVGNILAEDLAGIRGSSVPTPLPFSWQTEEQAQCRSYVKAFQTSFCKTSSGSRGYHCFTKEAMAPATTEAKASSGQMQREAALPDSLLFRLQPALGLKAKVSGSQTHRHALFLPLSPLHWRGGVEARLPLQQRTAVATNGCNKRQQ